MILLFKASEKYIIINSSNTNVHPRKFVPQHIKHRIFTNWVEQHAPNFRLLERIPIPI